MLKLLFHSHYGVRYAFVWLFMLWFFVLFQKVSTLSLSNTHSQFMLHSHETMWSVNICFISCYFFLLLLLRLFLYANVYIQLLPLIFNRIWWEEIYFGTFSFTRIKLLFPTFFRCFCCLEGVRCVLLSKIIHLTQNLMMHFIEFKSVSVKVFFAPQFCL